MIFSLLLLASLIFFNLFAFYRKQEASIIYISAVTSKLILKTINK